jgi:uncharacterized membrane protein
MSSSPKAFSPVAAFSALSISSPVTGSQGKFFLWLFIGFFLQFGVAWKDALHEFSLFVFIVIVFQLSNDELGIVVKALSRCQAPGGIPQRAILWRENSRQFK